MKIDYFASVTDPPYRPIREKLKKSGRLIEAMACKAERQIKVLNIALLAFACFEKYNTSAIFSSNVRFTLRGIGDTIAITKTVLCFVKAPNSFVSIYKQANKIIICIIKLHKKRRDKENISFLEAFSFFLGCLKLTKRVLATTSELGIKPLLLIYRSHNAGPKMTFLYRTGKGLAFCKCVLKIGFNAGKLITSDQHRLYRVGVITLEIGELGFVMMRLFKINIPKPAQLSFSACKGLFDIYEMDVQTKWEYAPLN